MYRVLNTDQQLPRAGPCYEFVFGRLERRTVLYYADKWSKGRYVGPGMMKNWSAEKQRTKMKSYINVVEGNR